MQALTKQNLLNFFKKNNEKKYLLSDLCSEFTADRAELKNFLDTLADNKDIHRVKWSRQHYYSCSRTLEIECINKDEIIRFFNDRPDSRYLPSTISRQFSVSVNDAEILLDSLFNEGKILRDNDKNGNKYRTKPAIKEKFIGSIATPRSNSLTVKAYQVPQCMLNRVEQSRLHYLNASHSTPLTED